MKRLMSTAYPEWAFNSALFLLRISAGLLILINHGVPKIANFSKWQVGFYDPFHISSKLSLILSISAEVGGAALVVLGLFSRFGALLLTIDLFFAGFVFQHNRPVTAYEDAVIYFTAFLTILLVGPGKISADAATGK